MKHEYTAIISIEALETLLEHWYKEKHGLEGSDLIDAVSEAVDHFYFDGAFADVLH